MSFLAHEQQLLCFGAHDGQKLFCSQLPLAPRRPGKPGSVDLIHGNEAGWGVDCHWLGHKMPDHTCPKGRMGADCSYGHRKMLSPRVPSRTFQCMHTSRTALMSPHLPWLWPLLSWIFQYCIRTWCLASAPPPPSPCLCLSVFPRCKRLKSYFYPVSVFPLVTFLVYLLISGNSL